MIEAEGYSGKRSFWIHDRFNGAASVIEAEGKLKDGDCMMR